MVQAAMRPFKRPGLAEVRSNADAMLLMKFAEACGAQISCATSAFRTSIRFQMTGD